METTPTPHNSGAPAPATTDTVQVIGGRIEASFSDSPHTTEPAPIAVTVRNPKTSTVADRGVDPRVEDHAASKNAASTNAHFQEFLARKERERVEAEAKANGTTPPPAGDQPGAEVPEITPDGPLEHKEEDPLGTDPLDTVEEPETLSKSAKDSWQKLKQASKDAVAKWKTDYEALQAEHSAAASKLETLQAELAEAQEKAGKLTPDLEAELADLRNLRRTVDLENDPEFRGKYVDSITQSKSKIDALMVKAKFSEEVINKIKSLNYDIDWTKIKSALGGMAGAALEAEVANIGKLSLEYEEQLAAAGSKADKYEKITQQRVEKIATTAQGLLGKIVADIPIPSTTPPSERKQLEAQNKIRQGLRERAAALAADESISNRSKVTAAAVLAEYYGAELDNVRAENAELKAKLDAHKNAGGGKRLPTTPAAPATPPAPKPAVVKKNGEDLSDTMNGGMRARMEAFAKSKGWTPAS